MWFLDRVFLATVLALTYWRLFAPAWRPEGRVAAVVLGTLLAIGQWALYGFTWQSLPAYLLLLLSASPPSRRGAGLRLMGRLALVGVAAACVGVWILPAVPTLPPPDGQYPVGTRVFRWTDVARDEPHTAAQDDHRSVIAQAWYPATVSEQASASEPVPYIDGIGEMPDEVSGVPSFFLHRYGQIDTHARALAPLASSERPWPVVMFSPGYGAPRATYTGLAIRLASRGFFVVVLDHPFESAVTRLPDGQVVGLHEIFPSDRTQYMPNQQIVRTADIRFAIDQLARPDVLGPPMRGGRIDVSRVAVIGHSFGGAVSAMVMSEDPRVVAAANIDGTPYGDLPQVQLSRPFLLLQSDYAETNHSELFIEGNRKILASSATPGFHYEIKRANHYSFTDAPFYFSPPGRWLIGLLMGGRRGPAATQEVTADMLSAFLSGPLTGVPADLAATATRYLDVISVSPMPNGSPTP